MTKDPGTFELTEWQAALLANIFRNILREISRDEDKEKLAPGELGINYKSGAFYVRNPHTGELFSPNNMEVVKLILGKFDVKNNVLNSDKVGDVTFYSRLGQLDHLTVDFTPDSVIRQMVSPSMFFGAINYENYSALGWPSSNGMCMIFKISEECAVIRYYDNRTFSLFQGKYNYIRHQFEGWGIGGNEDSYYAESYHAGDNLVIHFDSKYRDLDVVAVRLTESLFPEATVSVNGTDPLPIVTIDKKPIQAEIPANTTIMLIYDEQNTEWVLFDPTDSAVYVTMTLTTRRLMELRSYTEKLVDNLDEKFHDDLDRTAKQLSEQHDTDIERLVQKHTQDIRETVEKHTEDIQRLTEKHDQDLEQQSESFQHALDTAKEQHDADMQTQTEALNEAMRRHDEDLNAMRDAFNEALNQVKEKHDADMQAQTEALDAAKEKHEEDMGKQGRDLLLLKKKHDEDMEALTKAFNDQLAEARRDAIIALNEAVEKLNQRIRELSLAPGNLYTVVSSCRIGSDNVTAIPMVEGFDGRYDKLMVNYGQTILRPDIDYTIVNNGVKFADGLVFVNGDTIQFTVFKQSPVD